LADTMIGAWDRHIVKFGGGLLLRRLDGFLTAGRDGRYLFLDFLDFMIDRPTFFSVSVARQHLPGLQVPQFNREYRYNQFNFFVQDTFKVTPRLVLNFGLRYENFGAPRNTGPIKDAVAELGEGADFPARLRSARLSFPGSGDQNFYESDNRNWAPRFGFSYDLTGTGKMPVRGAYGVFFDRPFDNLWQNLRNNNFVLPTFVAQSGDYLAPVSSVLPSYQSQTFAGDFPLLTVFQKDLRNGYAQSYFLGFERRLGEAWAVEVNALGALGRRLVTTDQVNRRDGLHNPGLPILSYRGHQGLSNYHALAAVARYRAGRAQLQAAYTWSHAIDLQSEPLASDFFDLSFTRVTPAGRHRAVAAFTRQFDSRGDRANSDFDQRHNLVLFSIWDLPRLLASSKAGLLFRDWRFSQLAAFRTGFPYTVFAASSLAVFNNRADLVGPGETNLPAPGGRRILNASAFRQPSPDQVGNSGRNAFRGPGLFNVDVSLSRSFALPWLGEAGRLTLRADAFNVLNHANLNNPDSFLGSEDFGIALYGRRGRDTGFPALSPLIEIPRQIQVILRIEF